MYNEKIISLLQNPINIGHIAKPDGLGKVVSQECGDIMELSIRLEGDQIIDAKVQTFGCAPAIACACVVADLVKNKPIDQITSITSLDVIDNIGALPESKIYCADMAAELIKSCYDNYLVRQIKLGKKLLDNEVGEQEETETSNESQQTNNDEQTESEFDVNELFLDID